MRRIRLPIRLRQKRRPHPDIVIAVEPADASRLVALLETNYHVDADAVAEAITMQRSFNAIHHGGVIKVDTRSEMQLRDTKNLLGGEVDGTYLDEWVARLGLADVLAEAKR
jgi:hypothetical protein